MVASSAANRLLTRNDLENIKISMTEELRALASLATDRLMLHFAAADEWQHKTAVATPAGQPLGSLPYQQWHTRSPRTSVPCSSLQPAAPAAVPADIWLHSFRPAPSPPLATATAAPPPLRADGGCSPPQTHPYPLAALHTIPNSYPRHRHNTLNPACHHPHTHPIQLTTCQELEILMEQCLANDSELNLRWEREFARRLAAQTPTPSPTPGCTPQQPGTAAPSSPFSVSLPSRPASPGFGMYRFPPSLFPFTSGMSSPRPTQLPLRSRSCPGRSSDVTAFTAAALGSPQTYSSSAGLDAFGAGRTFGAVPILGFGVPTPPHFRSPQPSARGTRDKPEPGSSGVDRAFPFSVATSSSSSSHTPCRCSASPPPLPSLRSRPGSPLEFPPPLSQQRQGFGAASPSGALVGPSGGAPPPPMCMPYWLGGGSGSGAGGLPVAASGCRSPYTPSIDRTWTLAGATVGSSDGAGYVDQVDRHGENGGRWGEYDGGSSGGGRCSSFGARSPGRGSRTTLGTPTKPGFGSALTASEPSLSTAVNSAIAAAAAAEAAAATAVADVVAGAIPGGAAPGSPGAAAATATAATSPKKEKSTVAAVAAAAGGYAAGPRREVPQQTVRQILQQLAMEKIISLRRQGGGDGDIAASPPGKHAAAAEAVAAEVSPGFRLPVAASYKPAYLPDRQSRQRQAPPLPSPSTQRRRPSSREQQQPDAHALDTPPPRRKDSGDSVYGRVSFGSLLAPSTSNAAAAAAAAATTATARISSSSGHSPGHDGHNRRTAAVPPPRTAVAPSGGGRRHLYGNADDVRQGSPAPRTAVTAAVATDGGPSSAWSSSMVSPSYSPSADADGNSTPWTVPTTPRHAATSPRQEVSSPSSRAAWEAAMIFSALLPGRR